MKLSSVFSVLVAVCLLMTLISGAKPGVGQALANEKSGSILETAKVTLPGRKVLLPKKKEALIKTATKSFKRLGKTIIRTVSEASRSVASLKRNIKAYLASDFEVLLLDMTVPTNEQTRKVDLTKFMDTTKSFIYNTDMVSESNTYRTTLRKIWAKISEKDPRTVLKALHILHVLLADSKHRHAAIYKSLIIKMSKEKYGKSGHNYFSPKVFKQTFVGSEDTELIAFTRYLFSYVILRGKYFTARFEELSNMNYKTKDVDVLAQIDKAAGLLDAALQCAAGLTINSEAVVACLGLLARDLRDLFGIFAKQCHWVLQEAEVGDLLDSWNDSDRRHALDKLKKGYSERYGKVASFLQEVGEMTEMYGLGPPVTLTHAKDWLDAFQ